MKMKIKNTIERLTNALVRRYKLHVVKDPFTVDAQRWFDDNGDATLRLEYPLTEESVVLDLGGYKGDFAADVIDKFNCHVLIFEPDLKFYQHCVSRFSGNPKVRVFHYGLSDCDGEFWLSDSADASSFYDSEGGSEGSMCSVKKYSNIWEELKLSNIDLLKMNIEGAEYSLLEHIIDTGLIKNIHYLQVQFHNFVDDAETRRNNLVDVLNITHEREWCYEFIWESWQRNNG